MFYLLHGDDEFGSREQLKQLRQQGDFGYNQDSYDGSSVDFKTIVITSNTFPFLSEQRLVVVDGLPKRKRGEAANVTEQVSAPADAASDDASKTARGRKSKKGKTSELSRVGFVKALAENAAPMPGSPLLMRPVE